jgi:hypothetical protein
MSKAVVMLPRQWDRLREELKKREKPSVFLSRSKMKEVLGFTVRNHEEWIKFEDSKNRDPEDEWLYEGAEGYFAGKKHERTIRLDFYDEPKRTMFLLKYGDWLRE